jgi:hypothetical protein
MLNYTEEELERLLRQNPALRVNQKHSQPGKKAKPEKTKTEKKKPRKYRNKKVLVNGIKFDSLKEAKRYIVLKMKLLTGEITYLKLQPEFVLQEGFRKDGKWHRAIKYRADFRYRTVAGETVIEDTKGYRTEVFNIKQKLFESRYPELSLKLI